MNTIRFLAQLILSVALTWGFMAFIVSKWDVWNIGGDGKAGAIIALIILFIIVKCFTETR